jgi:hypothetical protein
MDLNGLGIRIKGLDFRVLSLSSGVQCFGVRVSDSGSVGFWFGV